MESKRESSRETRVGVNGLIRNEQRVRGLSTRLMVLVEEVRGALKGEGGDAEHFLALLQPLLDSPAPRPHVFLHHQEVFELTAIRTEGGS